jgi:Carboxypeptidase regulatory-like domain
MKRFHWYQSAAAGVAALGLMLPAGVTFAADTTWSGARAPAAAVPARQAPVVVDVSLANGGVLTGQVVDAQGQPLAGTPVAVRSAQGMVTWGTTDRGGRFQLAGLGGGLYEVSAAQRSGAFRLWANNSSPPSAVKQVMLVAGEPVARGQHPTDFGNRQGGNYFGGLGAFWGGVIILGSLGGIVAGGIITGEQGTPAS